MTKYQSARGREAAVSDQTVGQKISAESSWHGCFRFVFAVVENILQFIHIPTREEVTVERLQSRKIEIVELLRIRESDLLV